MRNSVKNATLLFWYSWFRQATFILKLTANPPNILKSKIVSMSMKRKFRLPLNLKENILINRNRKKTSISKYTLSYCGIKIQITKKKEKNWMKFFKTWTTFFHCWQTAELVLDMSRKEFAHAWNTNCFICKKSAWWKNGVVWFFQRWLWAYSLDGRNSECKYATEYVP